MPNKTESAEKPKLQPQVGESITCNFRENTWTFKMPKGFIFTGGKFSIVPTEQLKTLLERSKDNG